MNEITRIRESLNMTQNEFAKFLQIPYNTVRRWEKKGETPPKPLVDIIENKVKSMKK